MCSRAIPPGPDNPRAIALPMFPPPMMAIEFGEPGAGFGVSMLLTFLQGGVDDESGRDETKEPSQGSTMTDSEPATPAPRASRSRQSTRPGFTYAAAPNGLRSWAMAADTFTDPAFLEKLRARDELAVRAVVHTYLPQILRAARAGGLSEDEARDTTQNTFTTFIEKLPEFEGRSHIRTWLFGILYRKIQESYRARQRSRNLDDINEVMEARFDERGHWIRPPRPVDLQMEDAQVRASLEDCMDGLSENQRMAFILREVQGYTTDEICKILSVTVTNLGVMMYRARNRLRECLEAKGVGGP